jgi:DNA gyrase/topoisomerase IV subunit B
VIATDADVDGIRLLVLFFYSFSWIDKKNIYISNTSFRVQKKKTIIAILRKRKSILKTETKTGNYPI